MACWWQVYWKFIASSINGLVTSWFSDLLQVDLLQDQRTCYKLIFKTCYPRNCCKLLQQVVTSLRMISCNKPDFNRPVTTWCTWQVCSNLTSCNMSVKLKTSDMSVPFLAVFTTILCDTIPYRTLPYHTIPLHTITYHTMPCHTIYTMTYHAISCHTIYHPIPHHTNTSTNTTPLIK